MTARIERLPVDAKARRERQLTALWAEEDRMLDALKKLRARLAPLQRDVSLDQGYGFTISREKLERALRRGR